MLTSMGVAASHADVLATIAKLESVGGFTWASRGFGVVGVGFDVAEIATGNGDWLDYAQVAAGVALLIPGLNGAVAIGLGTVLFASTIYEAYQTRNQ
ncbi:hypothetical protein [Albibacterium profundi]|uniref:Uncharacterized protein n=1 Tax=Albibacterium profundi TaxID=3134906 RepID=A0ABV5CDT3_9SPHI